MERKRKADSENKFVKAIGAQRLIVLLVVIALFVFFISRLLHSEITEQSSMLDNSAIGFMAIGVTLTLLTGGVDFSIGTGMICYVLFGGYLISKVGLPAWAGILCTILLGVVIGLANAVLVAVMNLPPFIATLCTMMICRGLGSVLTGGVSVVWPQLTQPGGWFRNIFKINANGTMIPVGFIVLIAFAVIMSIVLNKTRPGRYIIAVGSKKKLQTFWCKRCEMAGTAYVLSRFVQECRSGLCIRIPDVHSARNRRRS
ncbi:MAG: ABC transporter permease [Eisenbergiella sp.]